MQALDFDALGATRNMDQQVEIEHRALSRFNVIQRPWDCGIGAKTSLKRVHTNLRCLATVLYWAVSRNLTYLDEVNAVDLSSACLLGLTETSNAYTRTQPGIKKASATGKLRALYQAKEKIRRGSFQTPEQVQEDLATTKKPDNPNEDEQLEEPQAEVDRFLTLDEICENLASADTLPTSEPAFITAANELQVRGYGHGRRKHQHADERMFFQARTEQWLEKLRSKLR